MPQRDILGYMQSDEESHVKAKSQFTWTVLSVSGQGNYYEVRVGCVREYADTQTTFSSPETSIVQCWLSLATQETCGGGMMCTMAIVEQFAHCRNCTSAYCRPRPLIRFFQLQHIIMCCVNVQSAVSQP